MSHLGDRTDHGAYGKSVSESTLVLMVSLSKPLRAGLSLVEYFWMTIWMQCPVGP
jgi:hypothetical protein